MSRNIVVICLDAVRKDYFDEYAPRLQREADVSFDQCRAASSWTVPSHASMMTGELPHRHGIHASNPRFSGLDRSETFLGDLEGYRTLGASANVYASSAFGFDTLFDDFSDVNPHHRFPDGVDMEAFFLEHQEDGLKKYSTFFSESLRTGHPFQSVANGVVTKANQLFRRSRFATPFDNGATLISREAARLVEDADEPLFLFANFMDAHAPLEPTRGYDDTLYSVPNDWHSYRFDMWELITQGNTDDHRREIENYRELYGAAIEYLDRCVTELIDEIRERTEYETTVIVTADHGECLGYVADDHEFEHMMSSLAEGLLHVPFVLIDPPDGYMRTESALFSQLELGRLVRGIANDETPDVFTERIPAERVGLGAADAPVSEKEYRYLDRMIRCVYDGSSKVLWDSLGNSLEYELDESRPSWERVVDPEATVPEWADAFFDEEMTDYKSRMATTRAAEPKPDEHVEQRLRDLGYR